MALQGVVWVDVLESIGWPTDVVTLDFETYFSKDYSLSKLSTIEYIESRHFEEIGVAILECTAGWNRPTTFWPDAKAEVEWLQARYGPDLEHCTLVIQNARFDGTILARKHNCTPRYVIDIKFLSRHLDARNRHGLQDICAREGLIAKGDTKQFLGLHWADMTKDQQLAMHRYACNDAEIEFAAFKKLLPRITRPEVEIPLMMHTQGLYWTPRLAFDFDKASDLIVQINNKIIEETRAVGATVRELRGEASFKKILGEALAETGETVPMKQGKTKMLLAVAKDDFPVKDLLRHKNPKVRAVMKARLAMKSWPLHQKRVQSMVAQARAAGGLLCNPLNYYGSHTGRWSGGEKINTCNFPARGGGLKCEIKKCLIARPGHVLIMADAAQIEARGLAWIAGQTDLLEAFARDEDVYSQFAAEVLAAPVRKPQKDDPPPVAKLLGGRRALGKVGILGMGYGMGPSRALDYMADFPELAPKVESGEIDFDFCKRFVYAYRNKYPMIPKFWTDVENVFRFALKYDEVRTLRNLTFTRSGTTVEVRLPSGRCLFYPQAAVIAYNQLRYRWGHLWGGVICENVVQAISRDILAEAILFIEDQGFRVLHHIYDSVIVDAEESQEAEALAVVNESLTRVPDWALNWPLGVESFTGKVYQ